MPTRRLPDPVEGTWLPRPEPCHHPDHNPPSHMVFEPGTYEHECSGCGKKLVFTVPRITCSAPLVTTSFTTSGKESE